MLVSNGSYTTKLDRVLSDLCNLFMKDLDADGDGKVTRAEIKQYVSEKLQAEVDRLWMCQSIRSLV